jgi:hypothetical protein
VTFTAVFTTNGNRVMITLESDPTGAVLQYTIETLIGTLNEITYTAPFPMARSEKLDIKAEATLSGDSFIRWENSLNIVIGVTTALQDVELPSGASGTYTAMYADPVTGQLVVTMDQAGGAGVALSYILNNNTYAYTGQFTIRKSDVISLIAAAPPATHEFVRWQDSLHNVVSTDRMSGNIDPTDYGATVTFTAVFTTNGNRVMITLESDPAGAVLQYTIETLIGTLNEITYTAPFPMARSEKLEIKTEASMINQNFIRWENSAGFVIGMSTTVSNLSLFSGDETYTALYAQQGDYLEVTMDQTGGAGAVLSYILNNNEYTYDAPFYILNADAFAVVAAASSTHDFVRWQDSLHNIVSTDRESDDIDPTDYVTSVTFTAVFTTAGGRVMVTLDSNPAGAILQYTIGSLNEVTYTMPFPMARSETLVLNAPPIYSTLSLIRWQDHSGTIIETTDALSGITMPSSGTAVTFTAVYNIWTITLGDHDNGKIQWSTDGVNYRDFDAAGKWTFPRGVNVWLQAEGTVTYEFSYWYDDLAIAGDTNPYSFVITSDMLVSAAFYGPGTSLSFTVTPDMHDNGKIQWSIDDVNYFDLVTGGKTFPQGTTVYLEAVADSGYEFMVWTGDVPPASIMVAKYTYNGSLSITVGAIFDIGGIAGTDYFTVTLGVMTHGAIQWSEDGMTYNDFPNIAGTFLKRFPISPAGIYLMAVGNIGYEFSYWTGGIGTGETNPYMYTAMADITVGAVFANIGGVEGKDYFTVTFNHDNTENGTVLWSLTGNISNPAEWWPFLSADGYKKVFPLGTIVYLGAEGSTLGGTWKLSYWTGDLGGNTNPETVMTTAKIGAVFYDESNTVSFFKLSILNGMVDNGKIMWSVTVNGVAGMPAELTSAGAFFPLGTEVDLVAVADTGYQFSHWIDAVSLTHAQRDLKMNNHHDVNAMFIKVDDGIVLWLILLIAAAALLLIFLFTHVRYRVTGTITCNGRGLEGVTVEYTMNGKSGTAVTDAHGQYRIRALAGAEVAITSVAIEGYTVSGTLPEPFVMEKATSMDFVMEKT